MPCLDGLIAVVRIRLDWMQCAEQDAKAHPVQLSQAPNSVSVKKPEPKVRLGTRVVEREEWLHS